MKGRKPKPTRAKALAGNPGKRTLNHNVPQPDQVIPRCPSHLSAEAKREWHRLVKVLHKAGLLTKVDRGALALYCQAWGRWVEAERSLQTVGLVVLSAKGGLYQNPMLAIANKAMDQMHRLGAEFGMNPSARMRLSISPPEEMDELEALLFGRRVEVA